MNVLLSDVIHNSSDGWLRDIASEAVTLHLGTWVVVSNPKYTPIGHDSEKGTLRITCYLEGQED